MLSVQLASSLISSLPDRHAGDVAEAGQVLRPRARARRQPRAPSRACSAGPGPALLARTLVGVSEGCALGTP